MHIFLKKNYIGTHEIHMGSRCFVHNNIICSIQPHVIMRLLLVGVYNLNTNAVNLDPSKRQVVSGFRCRGVEAYDYFLPLMHLNNYILYILSSNAVSLSATVSISAKKIFYKNIKHGQLYVPIIILCFLF